MSERVLNINTTDINGNPVCVDIYSLTKGMSTATLAAVLSSYMGTLFGDQERQGVLTAQAFLASGPHLNSIHGLIWFVIGMLKGLALCEFVDMRNQAAVAMATKLSNFATWLWDTEGWKK
jgi:hypothetical protein